MAPEILARATTTDLVYEAIQRYGPLTEREIGSILSESPRALSAALNRLVTARRVAPAWTAEPGVLLWWTTP